MAVTVYSFNGGGFSSNFISNSICLGKGDNLAGSGGCNGLFKGVSVKRATNGVSNVFSTVSVTIMD